MLLRFSLLIILLIKKSTSATVTNDELEKEGNIKFYLLVTSISKRIDELFLEIIRIASRSPRYRAA